MTDSPRHNSSSPLNPFDLPTKGWESISPDTAQAILANTSTRIWLKADAVTVVDVGPAHRGLLEVLADEGDGERDDPQFAVALVVGPPGSGKTCLIAASLTEQLPGVQMLLAPTTGEVGTPVDKADFARALGANVVVIDEVWQFASEDIASLISALQLNALATNRQVFIILITQKTRDVIPIADALPPEVLLVEVARDRQPAVYVGDTVAVLDPARKHELHRVNGVNP